MTLDGVHTHHNGVTLPVVTPPKGTPCATLGQLGATEYITRSTSTAGHEIPQNYLPDKAIALQIEGTSIELFESLLELIPESMNKII